MQLAFSFRVTWFWILMPQFRNTRISKSTKTSSFGFGAHYWSLIKIKLCPNFETAGMDYSTGGIHGKMEFMAQTVQFCLGGTSHLCFKLKTKSAAISTFLHFCSTKPPEALAASESGAALGFLFLSLLLPEISLYLLETGSR